MLALERLRCPGCYSPLAQAPKELTCAGCGRCYALGFPFGGDSLPVIEMLPSRVSETKNRIQQFWGDIYQQWYEQQDQSLDETTLLRQLAELEDMFKKRRHLAVTGMDLSSLTGRSICEIGSGAGAHSALFRLHGADVTSVDITRDRVLSTARKLALLSGLPNGGGTAIQADAEALPFKDNTFDIVYSNGVLHHTENTDQTLREVYRILKPGGQAVLMLYSRHSALFWGSIWPRALLSGDRFRFSEAEWIGRQTEGKPARQTEKNPITRVYSERELRSLLRQFQQVELTKSSFTFGHLLHPWGEYVRAGFFRLAGRSRHPGGILVYGNPNYVETDLEQWLGQWLGFGWNIRAQKPGNPDVS
jgi:ubiquinone/menaquinone biosynthesis C-methylase UbiE